MTGLVPPAAWEPAYAGRAGRMRASEIRELLKLLDRPGIISFAGGIPDPALLPAAQAQAAYRDVLADPLTAKSSLQYSTSEGYAPLRDWVVAHMGERGIACTPDNIVMTNGSQQALEFLGRLVLSPNETKSFPAQAPTPCLPGFVPELRPTMLLQAQATTPFPRVRNTFRC